jgi:hypothetical protein
MRGRTERQSLASVARAGCVDKPKLADVACPRSSPYARKSSRSSLRVHRISSEKAEEKRLYVRRQPEARLCRISRRQEPFLPERRDELDQAGVEFGDERRVRLGIDFQGCRGAGEGFAEAEFGKKSQLREPVSGAEGRKRTERVCRKCATSSSLRCSTSTCA